jgi:mono/diheme cytochrome c family protein
MRSIFALLAIALAAPALADGREIFMQKCSGCHGEGGKGDTKLGAKLKIPDLSSAKFQKRHTDAQIKGTIVDGVPDTKMKAFKEKLSESEIDEVVKFVRTLGPKE